MTKLVDFLAKSGSDSVLSCSPLKLLDALTKSHLEAAEVEAITRVLGDRDSETSEIILQRQSKIYCLLFPPKEDEPQKEAPEDDEEREDTEEKSSETVKSLRMA